MKSMANVRQLLNNPSAFNILLIQANLEAFHKAQRLKNEKQESFSFPLIDIDEFTDMVEHIQEMNLDTDTAYTVFHRSVGTKKL